MAKKDWMVSAADIDNDDDQYKILNAVLDKSCIVSGCAGSGKSVLALLKAQRIQKEKGSNYQIIVFTEALCDYMNAGRKDLGLTNTFKYHWKWVNREGCPTSDYIIVDEIQDFDEEEIRQFCDAAQKNFFFFGDTAQSIYEGMMRDGMPKKTVPVEGIVRILPSNITPKSFALYRNYRLPIPVAKVAQQVGLDLEPFDERIYKSMVETMPRFLGCVSLQEQLSTIKKIIDKRGFSDVAILLQDNNMVIRVHEILNEIGLNHEARYRKDGSKYDTLDFSTPNPKVMTYHSAKGLQFEAVFIPGAEQCSYGNNFVKPIVLGRGISRFDCPNPVNVSKGGDCMRKALYVAMTRTYNYLYVLYTGALGSSLSGISSDLYQTSDEDNFEEI